MNNDKLDNLIEKSFKEDNNISPFSDDIDNLIGSIFKKRARKRKILFFIPIVLTSTAVFAISYNIFNLSSVGLDDSCIETATKNGYVQTLDIPFQTFDNLGVKIDHFLIDDINFDISFEYEINNYDIKDIKNVFIQDICIYDENNNVIYMEENEKSNSISNIADTMGYSKIRKASDNTFKNTFFAQSNNFPKSKKIYIEFSNIILNCKNENKTIQGIWKFEIKVPENMIDRENIGYKCISNNNEGNISIKNIKLSNTGLILQADSNSYDILDKAKINIIANGKKYKSNNNLFDINIKENLLTNKTQRIYTFNITKYDIPNEIIVKVKYGNSERDITFIKDENK